MQNGRQQKQHDFCSLLALVGKGREQLLFLASSTGYALSLVSPNIKCVSSPGSKEWKLGVCSLLYCTNCIINKARAKWIKNRLPSPKWIFKKKPVHLFRA